MTKIVYEKCPPLPNNLSDEMKDFLDKCFQKDPLQRENAE
jgi:serine/threonine protein kinase